MATSTPPDPVTAKRYLPWVVATVMFMETLDATIVNTAIPSMAASLQVTPLSLKAVVASYILSLAVFIPVSGWMADRFGTRRVFFTAVSVLAATIAAVRPVARPADAARKMKRHDTTCTISPPEPSGTEQWLAGSTPASPRNSSPTAARPC